MFKRVIRSKGKPSSQTLVLSVQRCFIKALIVILTYCCGLSLALAGNNFWTSNGPNLPNIQTLATAPSNPQIVIAGTANGLFKSVNGGMNWLGRFNVLGTPIDGKNIVAVAVDPLNAQIVYVAVQGEGIYKTVNGGVNWTQMINGLTHLFINVIAIDPVTPTTVYVGTGGGGVFKSTNGGGNWIAINTGLNDNLIFSLAIDPSSPATVYVGTTFFVFKSVNGGGSWTVHAQGLPLVIMKSIAVSKTFPKTIYVGTDGEGVFRSTDGAAHWTEVNTGLPLSPIFINSVVADPGNSGIAYVGIIGGGIYRTLNSGANWVSVDNAVTKGLDVAALAISPKLPRTLYATVAGKGIAKTDQGGGIWRTINSGLASVDTVKGDWPLAIDPKQPSTIYAGSPFGGVYKSTDKGANWVLNGMAGIPVYDIAINPSNPQNMFAATASGVYRTSDGGNFWMLDNDGIGPEFVEALAINPANPLTIYMAASGNGVFWSENGGDVWKPRNTGMPIGLLVSNIKLAPNNPQLLYASSGGALFKSTNGGATWAQLPGPPELFGFGLIEDILIEPSNNNIVYVAASKLYKNTQGGTGTWTALEGGLPPGQNSVIVRHPIDPQTLFVSKKSFSSNNGVYKSTDAGQNWSPINVGIGSFKDFDFASLALDPTGNHLYAGSLGVFHLQITPNQLAYSRPSTQRWLFDLNRDGLENGCPPDRCALPFGLAGDQPIAGDWRGLGRSFIGVYRPSDRKWYLDFNGNRKLDACGVDKCLGPYGNAGDVPVTGDWFGQDVNNIGVFRPSTGFWQLDNGNGKIEACTVDKCYGPFGTTGDIPVAGDWRGVGRAFIGVYRPVAGQFLLDWNGNGKLDACTVDKCITFGQNGDKPVVGDWFGLGRSTLALFRPSNGSWFIDRGNFVWQGCLTDLCTGPFGKVGDVPFTGVW